MTDFDKMVDSNIDAARNTLVDDGNLAQKFMTWIYNDDGKITDISHIYLPPSANYADERTRTMLRIVLMLIKADGYAFATEAWFGKGRSPEEAHADFTREKRHDCLIIDCAERNRRVMIHIPFVKYGDDIVFGEKEVLDSNDEDCGEIGGGIGRETLFDMDISHIPPSIINRVKDSMLREQL